MTGISNVADGAPIAETPRRPAGDSIAMVVWDRGDPSGPPTLTDDQRRDHESISEQLLRAGQTVSAGTLHSGEPPAEEELASLLQDSVSQSPDADAPTQRQDALPAGGARWWRWTVALLGASAILSALETFVGRLGEAAVHAFSGHPQNPEEVSDRSMAAHAAVNIVMGLIAGARVGVHTWRASGNPEAYRRGFRGQRSAQSATFAMAGTPDVPASEMTRLLLSLATAFVAFGLAAHTGIRALSHLQSSSNNKVQAYEAVVRSNANTAYCYTREVAHFVASAFQLVSHDALLNLPGWAASSILYSGNSAVQQTVSRGIDQGRDFDLRWPAISAAAEAVDAAITSGAARLAEPDMPVEIGRGRLAEGTSAEGHPPSNRSVIDTIDRVTQRAVGRQFVGEFSKGLPRELHKPGIGPVLAATTHLRELMWQAEDASRGNGVSRAASDPEAPPPVEMVPNASSSPGPSALLQEGGVL